MKSFLSNGKPLILQAIFKLLTLLLKNFSSVIIEAALAPIFSNNGNTVSTVKFDISPAEGEAGLYSHIMDTSSSFKRLFLKLFRTLIRLISSFNSLKGL